MSRDETLGILAMGRHEDTAYTQLRSGIHGTTLEPDSFGG
jgi:hypothetical protein